MEHCLEMILVKLSGLLPCKFMQLLLHRCFFSYAEKSLLAHMHLCSWVVSGNVRVQEITVSSALTALRRCAFSFV